MNIVNYSNRGAISDPTYVGVDENRLVVTSKVDSFGTFQISNVSDTFVPLPWAVATNLRISNMSGKTIGVRPRHITSILDNFEDGNLSEWTGDIEIGTQLEGLVGAEITGTAYRPIENSEMAEGTEVDVYVSLPNNNYSVKIQVLDTIERLGLTPAGQAILNPSNSPSNTIIKVTIRLNPESGTYESFLENLDTGEYVSLGGGAGSFGSDNMLGSIIHFDSGGVKFRLDPIELKQSAGFPPEMVAHGGSFTYPCKTNISEYEVANIFDDSSVTISGFYAK